MLNIDLTTAHGSEIWAKYINRHTGRRSDAATGEYTSGHLGFLSQRNPAYVHGVMDTQSNLYLRTNARVSRVIFEGTKAVGVAYVPSRNRANNAAVQETIVSFTFVHTDVCLTRATGPGSQDGCLEQWNFGHAAGRILCSSFIW